MGMTHEPERKYAAFLFMVIIFKTVITYETLWANCLRVFEYSIAGSLPLAVIGDYSVSALSEGEIPDLALVAKVKKHSVFVDKPKHTREGKFEDAQWP